MPLTIDEKSISLLCAVFFEQRDSLVRRSNGYARVSSVKDKI